MNTVMLKRARRNFDRPGIPRHTVRHNIRAWARSIRHLGNNWLLAEYVERKDAQ
jgi:hypothetical protein